MITRKIDGFKVEIENGEERVQCQVSRCEGLRFYSASLAALQDTGVLETVRDGRTYSVPSATLEKIEAFATAMGF